jgi:hypothetical protein
MTFATLALAALLPAQAPAAPAKVVPMTVEVRTAAKADAAVQNWAQELRVALGTHTSSPRPRETPSSWCGSTPWAGGRAASR